MSRQGALYFQTSVTSKQRWSFFLLVGGYDQLVGNQIAPLSSCGVVILGEFLSSNYDLKSSTVRNVLRGWIAHGDVAAVWLAQTSTSFAATCLLKTCHEAHVVGFYAEHIHNTVSQSFEHCVNGAFGFQQAPVDMCAFGFPFRKRFMLFSVNVPVHLKLVRRCKNFGHVCSFSGKAHRQLGFCFQDRFLHRTPSSICKICCSCTCSLVPCQGQLD